jgi:peptide methionine sulfoxide reductase MsrA
LELALQRLPGVVGTSVGYTQGELQNPTYSQVCSGAPPPEPCVRGERGGKGNNIIFLFFMNEAHIFHLAAPRWAGMTGHAEAAEVIWDPAELSFEELLRVFWQRHDPTQLNRQGNDVGTQYRSGLYLFRPEHIEAAKASR